MLALLLAVPLLVFHGNVGLVGDVYRTVLDLPTGTKAMDAALSLTFDPESIRRDDHHQFALGARLYGSPHRRDDGALHLSASYQKMWPLGWNELWLEARGMSRTGFVVFPGGRVGRRWRTRRAWARIS